MFRVQGIANAGMRVGFYMSTDLKNLVHPAPTPSVSSVTISRSLMVSWVRPKGSFVRVSCLNDHPLDGCSHVLCVEVCIIP